MRASSGLAMAGVGNRQAACCMSLARIIVAAVVAWAVAFAATWALVTVLGEGVVR
jgi:hypothetical protein